MSDFICTYIQEIKNILKVEGKYYFFEFTHNCKENVLSLLLLRDSGKTAYNWVREFEFSVLL